jgi:sugar transferase (PEP-CTERM/EpsH1 system associated)
MTFPRDGRPLIAHIVHRLDIGGLENGVVNLINHLDPQCYRHAVIALTQITDFSNRVKRSDVQFMALNKPPGHGVKVYGSLYRLLRDMEPAVVHTRNLAALEATVPAWAAGVPVRIHGEHGRDVEDFDGSSRKYQWIRRLYRPFVTQYIAVSRELSSYLTARVGVPAERVTHIYNGVDTQRFRPAGGRAEIPGSPFADAGLWIIGTIGRMNTVKDQLTLARAFIRALEMDPSQRKRLRLIVIGDGPLRRQTQALLDAAGVGDLSWLPGERNDIPVVLHGLDCFVLPSLAEGVSNTILEAMASGLPVIATAVGGNTELVKPGRTGELVSPGNPEELAHKILAYAREPEQSRAAGQAGRARVERHFSLDAMLHSYGSLYAKQLGIASPRRRRLGAA